MRMRLALVFLLAATLTVGSLPAAGQLPEVVSVGSGCGVASPAFSSSLPILGATTTLSVTGAPPASSVLILASLVPASPVHLPGACVLHLDPSSLVVTGGLTPGKSSVAVPLPGIPGWVGARIALQALAYPTTAPGGYDLSNGLELTLGFRQGPLAGLPSIPGAHMSAIHSLGAGAWLDLGVPAPDPVYGLATGRGYTPRMPWSAALQGAFLTGEGVHGYVNPQTGRYVDDVWFYDLAGHRWLCVKPGSEVATLSLSLSPDQFEVDAGGNLVPVAQIGHGYEFVTFDEKSQRFFMQPAPNTYWVPAMPQRLSWLPSATFPETQYRSPWLYDTVAGHWTRHPVGATAPNFNVSARSMAAQSIPGESRIWVFDTSSWNSGRIWWFDPVNYAWIDVPTATPGPSVAGNGVTCYDAVHDRVWYYGVESATQIAHLWFYEVATRSWTDTNAAGTPAAPSIYATGPCGLTYDAAADVVLLKDESSTSIPAFHPFGVASNSWGPAITPPASLATFFAWASVNMFYAPEHNVHVLHVSASGSSTGRILVYRHATGSAGP